VEVRQDAVDAVRHRRADGAGGLVALPEHRVVDEQLGATVEELRQRPRSLLRFEPVLLLDGHPGQLAALPGELIPHPRVLLLALEQLVACGLPLLAASQLVLRHRLPPYLTGGSR
jgi:hypothetical protein